MSEISIDELRARLEAQSARLDEVIAELTSAICTDVPAFVARSARQVFVAQPLEHAAAQGEDEIRRLKQALGEHGERIASAARSTLDDRALWRSGDVPDGDSKSLEGNAALWHAVQEIARQTEEALRELGLQPAPGRDDLGLVYRTPTWFIDGKYPPGLVEKYWTQLALLRDLEHRITEETERQQREALGQRWDDV